MRFTYNGQWTPDTPVYWLDNETHADFYLYYPYADVNSVSAYNFAVNKDQSTETAYKASDFMVGKTTNVSPTAIATVIPASHTLSRIVVKLRTRQRLYQAIHRIFRYLGKINGVKCGSVIDIAKGTATPSGDATSVSPWRDGDTLQGYHRAPDRRRGQADYRYRRRPRIQSQKALPSRVPRATNSPSCLTRLLMASTSISIRGTKMTWTTAALQNNHEKSLLNQEL